MAHSWKHGKAAQEATGPFKWEDHPFYMPNHFTGGRDNVRSKYHFPAFAKALTVKQRFAKAHKELSEVLAEVNAKKAEVGPEKDIADAREARQSPDAIRPLSVNPTPEKE